MESVFKLIMGLGLGGQESEAIRSGSGIGALWGVDRNQQHDCYNLYNKLHITEQLGLQSLQSLHVANPDPQQPGGPRGASGLINDCKIKTKQYAC